MTDGPESQLIGAVLGYLADGRLVQAQAEATTAYQAGLAAGDKEGQASYLLLIGWTQIERGQPGQAVTTFLDGASINRELHDVAALRWCLAGLALAEAMRGNAGAAAVAAAERDGLPVGAMAVFEPDLVDRAGPGSASPPARPRERARSSVRPPPAPRRPVARRRGTAPA